MSFAIDPTRVSLLVSAAMALAGTVLLVRRAAGAGPRGGAAARRREVLLVAAALASGLGYFAFGSHPVQLVKTWDVEHSYLGSKYARELGYSRLYRCILRFDSQSAGIYRGIREVRDLEAGTTTMSRERAIAADDCDARFSPERRAAFLQDVAFFARLPRQPDRAAWFADNGYNMTPFFTALTSPLFHALPLRLEVLTALALLDVAGILVALLLLCGSYGLSVGCLAATFFFVNVPNQFYVMGGSILRFAYLVLLIAAACALRSGRPRAAGVALGVSTLLQVFPAAYACGLAAWVALRALRGARPPAWARPFALAFLATVLAGAVASAVVVGAGAWAEFAARISAHNRMLSLYRAGLELVWLLDWPPVVAGALPYADKLDRLAELRFLHLAAAGVLLGLAGGLAFRLAALEFALLLGTLALYVATPVHYYLATLVVLLLVRPERGGDASSTLTATLLFGLSALCYGALLAGASRAFVNNYLLSVGLLITGLAQLASLYAVRSPQPSPRLAAAP